MFIFLFDYSTVLHVFPNAGVNSILDIYIRYVFLSVVLWIANDLMWNIVSGNVNVRRIDIGIVLQLINYFCE